MTLLIFYFIQINNCVVIMSVQMRLCTTALYIIYIQEIDFSGASLSVIPLNYICIYKKCFHLQPDILIYTHRKHILLTKKILKVCIMLGCQYSFGRFYLKKYDMGCTNSETVGWLKVTSSMG